MNYLNILVGLISILIGLVWFIYELGQYKKLKKEKNYALLSSSPEFFLGIFILIFGGFLLMVNVIEL